MTPAELVREKRIVLAAGGLPLATIADLVAGERVRGDWRSHPSSEAIHRALGTLDEESDVRVCRLVAGRVTFVHASVWPAVIRLGGDGARVRAALRGVPSPARRLHDAVVERGAAGLRVDSVPHRLRAGRRHLELSFLVQTEEVRTALGKHAAILRAWEHVGSRRERRAASSLSLEEAADVIVEAMVRSAAPVRRTKLSRWIPLPPREVGFSVARLVHEGRLRETRGGLSPSGETG